MYSRNHALLSAAVGVPVAFAAPDGASAPLLWFYALALGVGIDFDHFLIARLNRGTWRPLRRCLADPTIVFFDQHAIFEPEDLRRDQRLLSHHIVGGALVAALWTVAPYWALATAATLYVHVVADLYADVRDRSSAEGGAGA